MVKTNFEKPILMLDKIIYPSSLYKILCDYLKGNKFLGMEFGKDCVRIISVIDTNEDRLNKYMVELRNMFKFRLDSMRMIIFDEEEVKQQIKDIIKQIENGIDEKAFYDWFIIFAIQLSQNNLPMKEESLEVKKGYLPVLKIDCYEIYDNDVDKNIQFYQSNLWLSSNGSLMNPITKEQLLKKAEKLIKEKINKKDKKNNIKKRNPLDLKLRHEVFKRDGYKCVECGAINKEKMLHCDHIISVAQGGTDEMDNLQTLCDDCNLAKSDKCWKGDLNKGDTDGKQT